MKKWLVLIVIGITVGLVVFPVGSASFAGVRTRWAMARVANLVTQDSDLAEAELDKLASRLAEPEKDRDYWIIRLRIALDRQDGEAATRIAKAALEHIPDYRVIPWIAYQHFYDLQDYESALRLLSVFYSREAGSLQSPMELNHLAYVRSLAVIDLDQGLQEINEAIKIVPNSEQFIDTRAWILFQMGRLPDALKDANTAVEIATKAYDQNQQSTETRLFRLFNGKTTPASSDGLLTETEADPYLWALGTIRYHRAKILEALGRTEQANEDLEWLRERQLPQDDRLR